VQAKLPLLHQHRPTKLLNNRLYPVFHFTLFNKKSLYIMIRILSLIALVATSLVANSCCICCTSDSEAPALRKLPAFQNLPAAPEVSYEK
jgi:hypothetical protein